jgi:proline dehydrogenase
VTNRSGQVLKRALHPFVARAGKALLVGKTRDDALALAVRLDSVGIPVTLAYWDGPDDTPASIEGEQKSCIDALTRLTTPARLSVKVPPLGFSVSAVRRLAATARDGGVGLVLDAHAPEDADRTLSLARHAADVDAAIWVAIPARWARSARDAHAALDDGIHVRIVKGQWPDPAGPVTERQLRSAFTELLAGLSPRASLVNVATHDSDLVRALLRNGGACRAFTELELLLGLPAARALHQTQQYEVPVRWYIPYGHPSTGFQPGELLRRPRLALTVARAVARGPGNRAARERELWGRSQSAGRGSR